MNIYIHMYCNLKVKALEKVRLFQIFQRCAFVILLFFLGKKNPHMRSDRKNEQTPTKVDIYNGTTRVSEFL